MFVICNLKVIGAHGSIMFETLCYKQEGCGFETQLEKKILSIYLILPATLDPGVYSDTNRNEYQSQKKNVSGQ
jgi:hypothetical protein